MKNYPLHIKNNLRSVIRDMAKHPEDFCSRPGKDFTRDRKLPFEKLLSLLVKMGGHPLRDEMLDCLDFKESPASVSALVQQRSKLLPQALEYLFHAFTNRCHKAKALQEYYKNCGTLDDDGLIVNLGSNVFLQISNDSNRAASVQAVIDAFKGVTFTPFDVSVPFNPAFDLLDVLAFSGGHTPENSHGPITSITRKIGGAMTLQCGTPDTQSNPARETVQVDGLSGSGTLTGTIYASSDFWIMINAFPNEETIIGDDTLTTELTVNCTVDNTCTQIAWTGAYYLDEDATVTVKILVDDEVIYQISDDQTAGNHVLNVTTGHNINTQGEHIVKVILREDVAE